MGASSTDKPASSRPGEDRFAPRVTMVSGRTVSFGCAAGAVLSGSVRKMLLLCARRVSRAACCARHRRRRRLRLPHRCGLPSCRLLASRCRATFQRRIARLFCSNYRCVGVKGGVRDCACVRACVRASTEVCNRCAGRIERRLAARSVPRCGVMCALLSVRLCTHP